MRTTHIVVVLVKQLRNPVVGHVCLDRRRRALGLLQNLGGDVRGKVVGTGDGVHVRGDSTRRDDRVEAVMEETTPVVGENPHGLSGRQESKGDSGGNGGEHGERRAETSVGK
jgi:hypothetical protein